MAYDNLTVTLSPPAAHTDLATTIAGAIVVSQQYDVPTLPTIKLKLGTGAAKANLVSKLYTATLAGAILDIDLTSLVDGGGNPVNLARAKGLAIYHLTATAGYTVLVGGAASNAWSAPFNGSTTAKNTLFPACNDATGALVPGKIEMAAPDATGIAVSGTSKILRLDPGANTVLVAYFLFGCDV